MELDGKVHVGNLHRVVAEGAGLFPPLESCPGPGRVAGEARFGSLPARSVAVVNPVHLPPKSNRVRFPANRDAVQHPVHGASRCFGHRYLQILFFRARLIKRETLSDKCSFFTIFLRGST